MSIQLAVAIISAVVALLSILLSARATRSNAELQARLQGELEQRRAEASKATRLEEVIAHYRDPLLSAAFELQSRIYNFVCGGFAGYLRSGDPAEQSYTVNSTLFVIAQYLAWTEALRRGVQFLDLGDVERNRQLISRLETIRSTFSTDINFTGPCRIFRAEQRAIGELMLEPSEIGQAVDMPWQCTGYAAFCSKLAQDESFSSWFARLDRDVRSLANSQEPDFARLSALQNGLMDLIDFLDDPPVRFPPNLRKKIMRYQPDSERTYLDKLSEYMSQEFSKKERETAIDILDHLVYPPKSKTAQSVSDLAYRTGQSNKQIGDVLEKLSYARIVQPIPPLPGQDLVRYEIADERLASAINQTRHTR